MNGRTFSWLPWLGLTLCCAATWAGPPKFEKANPLKLVGMRGFPPAADVDRLKKQGKDFFPFIDAFGQYAHRDWPGKTHSKEDIQRQAAEEAEDLKARWGPPQRNGYGGWTGGPKLRASGFFRVDKHEGRWWLVDPEGRLFWSHGIDCVHGYNAVTPISHRENYFELPQDKPPFDRFFGHGSWAPHGFYKDKGRYRAFNFTALNLYRKYGEDWKQRMTDTVHDRLRSWGMNTIGNWSSQTVYLKRRTPYVATIGFRSPPIAGSSGYWGQFPDPFHPDFRSNLRKRLDRQKGKAVGDPWCIGYFVGNELSWGKERSLAVAVLKSPQDQPAKRLFIEKLEAKYGKIDKLNRAWAAKHKDWNALLRHSNAPDRKRARDDLAAFEQQLHEMFFRVCREEVSRAAPQQLYLGCRFAWRNDSAIRAAAKYCHVVSFNRYHDDLSGFELPKGIDKPIIIGEFHFGALDRGLFHTGMRSMADQARRAQAYRRYVHSALDHRLIIGTHWFQYGDQAATGRGDGENYQIGFVDVCDRPYPEMIEAARAIGAEMYQRRAKQ